MARYGVKYRTIQGDMEEITVDAKNSLDAVAKARKGAPRFSHAASVKKLGKVS